MMENKIVSYPEFKCLAMDSIKKHLIQDQQQINIFNNNYYQNQHHHYPPHHHHSHSYNHNNNNENDKDNNNNNNNLIKNNNNNNNNIITINCPSTNAIIEYDISKLFSSIEDFNCVLNYWQYRFSEIDLVVGIEPNGLVIGNLFSQRLKLPFLSLKKGTKKSGGSSNNSTTSSSTILKEEFGNDYEDLEVEQESLSKLMSLLPYKNETVKSTSVSTSKKLQILIMDDLLENGSCLVAAIELVKKLLNQNQIKNYKISTTFISSIKSLGGKEKIYEMYNDISVDVINIIE